MNKYYILFLLLISAGLYAQEDAWVYFNAKPDPQPYFDNPNTILSQRAIDRRILQNIPLDIKDIPIEQTYIDEINELGTVNVMAKSKWLNAIHVRGTVAQINALADLTFVDHVYFANTNLNTTGKKARNRHANPLGKTLETAADFAYGGSGNQIQMLNGHLLHQQNFTGSGKIIAVMDAGFPTVDVTLPFKRLRDNNQILGGYNFVDRNDDFYSRNQHGTMVLSTMGGYVADELVGTAPDASYYLFITEASESENPIEESLWVEAAETADSLGVDVINTSLGYFGYDNPGYSYEYEDMNGTTSFVARGADIAFTRGMIVVASAGNSGNSNNPNIGTPADAANVLTIGAVDANGQYVSFSSIGPTSDGRVKPDVDAQGLAATIANTTGNVVTGSGTSFSGPIMAGMVATFWQAFPNLTNAQVVQLIKESASLFDTPTDEMGYGIPDFQFALTLAVLANEDFIKDKFIVYPNPAHDWLFVSIPETATEAEVVFYNDLGQVVAKKKINAVEHSVNISDLANGIYLYSITAGNKTQSGKLIKG